MDIEGQILLIPVSLTILFAAITGGGVQFDIT